MFLGVWVVRYRSWLAVYVDCLLWSGVLFWIRSKPLSFCVFWVLLVSSDGVGYVMVQGGGET